MNEWYKIELPRKNLWEWNKGKTWGNVYHYHSIKDWCKSHLPSKQWQSYIENQTGRKIFLFKEEKYLTMFLLRWSRDCKL